MMCFAAWKHASDMNWLGKMGGNPYGDCDFGHAFLSSFEIKIKYCKK